MLSLVRQQQRNQRQCRHGRQIHAHVEQAIICLQPGGDIRRNGRSQNRRDVIGERRAGITHFRREQLRQQRAHRAEG